MGEGQGLAWALTAIGGRARTGAQGPLSSSASLHPLKLGSRAHPRKSERLRLLQGLGSQERHPFLIALVV